MKREFIGGPMDGTEVPVDDEVEIVDEIIRNQHYGN